MSGHVGDRRNLQVALVTADMRVYHELVPTLEASGIRVVGLRPDEEVPETVQALIDGPPDDPRSIARRRESDATLLAILQKLDERPTATPRYRRVVFGVDPGAAIGLAVVADGSPLLVTTEHSAHAAAQRLHTWSTGLEAAVFLIHIGAGSPPSRDAIAEACAATLPSAPVIVVPEDQTTPTSPRTGSRHMDAAIHIALRSP